MGIKTNLALCALVFLIHSSSIRGQDDTVPISSAPALSQSEVPPTAPVDSRTVSASNSSSEPNGTVSTPLPQSPTSNSSSNSTERISPVSTPHPITQAHKSLPNETTTDLPVTVGSVGSPAPANATSNEEPTSSPGATIKPTTNSLSVSSRQPVDSTPNASVAHSSTPPPPTPPQFNVPVQTPTGSSPRTTRQPGTTNRPSEFNVGDEDASSPSDNSGAPLDPLLAGLVSVFIVSAAIVSLLLFIKFRKRNEGPEFRRLQDLPMDDMMEDTPLSMFSY